MSSSAGAQLDYSQSAQEEAATTIRGATRAPANCRPAGATARTGVGRRTQTGRRCRQRKWRPAGRLRNCPPPVGSKLDLARHLAHLGPSQIEAGSGAEQTRDLNTIYHLPKLSLVSTARQCQELSLASAGCRLWGPIWAARNEAGERNSARKLNRSPSGSTKRNSEVGQWSKGAGGRIRPLAPDDSSLGRWLVWMGPAGAQFGPLATKSGHRFGRRAIS